MSDSHDKHDDHGVAHVLPISTLLGVFFALLFLTWLTVSASMFIAARPQFHSFGVPIAMAIATVKALLVILYFMHLRYDKPLNNIIFFFCFAFFFLFISFTLIDSLQYQSSITDWMNNQSTSP